MVNFTIDLFCELFKKYIQSEQEAKENVIVNEANWLVNKLGACVRVNPQEKKGKVLLRKY